jgi:glutathione peroxidase
MVGQMGRSAAVLVALAVMVGVAACGQDDGTPASEPEGSQVSGAGSTSEPAGGQGAEGQLLSGELPLLNGAPQDLAEYRGEVVIVVNTASECGFTPQFEGLEALYEKRRRDGLVILGFPADDVAGQEPRSDQEIAEFCEENFGVSFPVFAKSNVVSEPVNPLFERLAAEAGEPSWNFNKYLIDRDGEVVERYDAGVAPDDPTVTARIDELIES